MWRNAPGDILGGSTTSRVVALAALPATVCVDERVQASVFLSRRLPPSVILNSAILGTTREPAARAWVEGVIATGALGFHVRIADSRRGQDGDSPSSRQ